MQRNKPPRKSSGIRAGLRSEFEPGTTDMNANGLEQKTEFLTWKIAPARLNALQAAWYLGFDPHEIPILVAAALLKPLGHPPRNGTKFFATEALEQLRRDEKWLAHASDAICAYWRRRNGRKRTCGHRAKGKPKLNRPTGLGLRGDASPTNGSATG